MAFNPAWNTIAANGVVNPLGANIDVNDYEIIGKSGSPGGDTVIRGGPSTGGGNDGADVNIHGGTSANDLGGDVNLYGGAGDGDGGTVNVRPSPYRTWFRIYAIGGTDYVGFQCGNSPASSIDYYWPTADPTDGQVLAAGAPSVGPTATTSGLSWVTAARNPMTADLNTNDFNIIGKPAATASSAGSDLDLIGGAGGATTGDGGGVTITGGSATSGDGGGVTITGQNAAGTGNSSGGDVTIDAGNSVGTTVGAAVNITAGDSTTTTGGLVLIKGGDGGGGEGAGTVTVEGGDSTALGTRGGPVYIRGGAVPSGGSTNRTGDIFLFTPGTNLAGTNTGSSGRISLNTGDTDEADVGVIELIGGDALAGTGDGGSIILQPGLAGGSGTNGAVKIFGPNLTTAGELRFYEDNNAVPSEYIGLKVPDDGVTTSVTLTLPDGSGTSGQVLGTDGGSPTATLSWVPHAATLTAFKQSTDTRVNTTTPTDDSELTFSAMEINSDYAVEGFLNVSNTGATPDFRFGFTVPSGATFIGDYIAIENNVGLISSNVTNNAFNRDVTISGSSTHIVKISGRLIMGANTGTFALKFSQATIHVTEQTRIINGSWMKITKM